MTKSLSYREITRLTGLLKEVREGPNMYGTRQINKYIDGQLKHNGSYEWYCQHCCAEAAAFYTDIQHEETCLLARIDVALAHTEKTMSHE